MGVHTNIQNFGRHAIILTQPQYTMAAHRHRSDTDIIVSLMKSIKSHL